MDRIDYSEFSSGNINDICSLDVNIALKDIKVSDRGLPKNLKFSNFKVSTDGLIVAIDASHLGYVNRNFKFYRGSAAVKSKKSWTYLRNKPFLKWHNGRTGEPIGTIVSAEIEQFTEWNDDYKINNNKPQGVMRLYAIINDLDAAKKFLDGRYSTVSVSGSPVGPIICSITKKDLTKMTPYERWDHFDKYRPGTWVATGKDGDGPKELCYLIYDLVEYDELSVVNMPADKYAKVTGFANEAKISDSFADGYPLDQYTSLFTDEQHRIHSSNIKIINGLQSDDTDLIKTEKSRMDETLSLKEILAYGSVKKHISEVTDGAVFDAVKPLKAEIAELKQQLSEANSVKDEITLKSDELQTQVDKLTADSADALANYRKLLIDEIIDMRNVSDNTDQEREKLDARQTQSLLDAYTDLRDAKASPLPIADGVNVKNSDDSEGDNGVIDENNSQEKPAKEPTLEESLSIRD